MKRRYFQGLAIAWLAWVGVSPAELPRGIRFRADFYKRDLNENTLKGKGHAWVKIESREIWADEIDVDFNSNRAIARGDVRMKDGDITIWSTHADFNMKGADAFFEKASLTSGQMVITGETIHRIDMRVYEIAEGTFSNCNTALIEGPQIAQCSMDWKISGRRFRLNMGGYAHFYDVVVSAKSVPFGYVPYMALPIKTERQSGILMPYTPWTANLGTGVGLPVYFALAPWQDLLVRPTYYSKTGTHLGLMYRYRYSDETNGWAHVFLLNRRFGPKSNPKPDDTSRPLALGLFGEGAVNAHNIIGWKNSRAQSRQMIGWVTNPYYTYDYSADVGPRAELANLRSQITYTLPTDEWLFTLQKQYLQSLIISTESGFDNGGVAQLPLLIASKTTSPLWEQLFSYELETQFANFTRSQATDVIPAGTVSGLTQDEVYVRTGRRLQVEPRLLMNVPVPPGFQFQPLLQVGTFLYNFDYPSFDFRHREYMQIEIPMAMQLSRLYRTSIPGYERVSHIVQPRFILASSLFQTGGDDHPFFYQQTLASGQLLSNPRFDILDQITPYQYMRFELINRVQRREENGGVQRFFWFQLSEQYNIKTSSIDPRYQTSLGPIEIFSSLSLGNYSMQLQAEVPLQETTRYNGVAVSPVKESSFSSGISYRGLAGSIISLNALYRVSANPGLNAQMANLYFLKQLPTFFDLEGYLEYNFLTHQFYGYRVGFHFRSKPRSCWNLSITTGRNVYLTQFTTIGFGLDLGVGHVQ